MADSRFVIWNSRDWDHEMDFDTVCVFVRVVG